MPRSRNPYRRASYWVTNVAPAAAQPQEPEHRPAPDGEPGPADLRFGYTLADLDRIAGYAARNTWTLSGSLADRYDAAWHGVAEHLYAAGEPPTGNDLVAAGKRAAANDADAEKRHHGVPAGDSYSGYGSGANFARYWVTATFTSPSPEPRVVEPMAATQILDALSAVDRETLLALAAHGTYEAAAVALGVSQGRYRSRVSDARRRFLALWHQGEPPSRVWRMDRRVNNYGETQWRKPECDLRAVRNHRARAKARQGADTGEAA